MLAARVSLGVDAAAPYHVRRAGRRTDLDPDPIQL